MKKINIIYLLLFLGFFSSCLDEDPKYTLNSKVIFENKDAAQLVLNGIYGALAVQGGFAQCISEINTEASGYGWVMYVEGNDRTQYAIGKIPVSNELNGLAWTALYKVIGNCNIFIDNCESGGSWSTKANMIAQAKFIRAVCYYTLYTFYGGVPLRLVPSTRENLSMTRASRQEVLDQIAKDLQEAIPDLDETSSLLSGKPTAPNKYSAYAYLTKLYWLQGCNAWAAEQGDPWASKILKESWPEMKSSKEYFQQAKVYGDSVLTHGNFELEGNFNTLFNGQRLSFSKEFVFVIDATGNTTENVGYNSLNWTYSPQNSTPGESWGRVQPSKAFYDWAHGTYQDDPRLKTTFLSIYDKFSGTSKTGEFDVAYPYVSKTITDTIGWKDSIIAEGLPPRKFPITRKEKRITDSIDYKDFSRYADPTNPTIDELPVAVVNSYGKTKGVQDYNFNDWPYFGKYLSYDVSGRYGNNNLYVYRYADFLLLMAEVENELGNIDQAIKLANKVLSRARNSATPASVYPKDLQPSMGQDQIRKYLYYERLFELAAEFDAFNDTRRRGIIWRKELFERYNNHHLTTACYEYGIANNYTGQWREYLYPDVSGTTDWNTFLIRNQLIPIPQKELSTNEKITINDQNPEY